MPFANFAPCFTVLRSSLNFHYPEILYSFSTEILTNKRVLFVLREDALLLIASLSNKDLNATPLSLLR